MQGKLALQSPVGVQAYKANCMNSQKEKPFF